MSSFAPLCAALLASFWLSPRPFQRQKVSSAGQFGFVHVSEPMGPVLVTCLGEWYASTSKAPPSGLAFRKFGKAAAKRMPRLLRNLIAGCGKGVVGALL